MRTRRQTSAAGSNERNRIERAGQAIEYIEATLEDIRAANQLADQVLGRSLDELPPRSRTLLGRLEVMVAAVSEGEALRADQVRFTRRDVRAHTGWSDFQVRRHLGKLESLEYVLAPDAATLEAAYGSSPEGTARHVAQLAIAMGFRMSGGGGAVGGARAHR